MMKALENLQSGLETSKSFQSFVTNHRILNLSLSNHTKLEKFHSSGVNALDIDKVDERYLISGGKDGALCIHDLHNSSGKSSFTPNLISEIPRHSRYSHAFSIDTVQWYPFDTGLFVSSGMDSKLKIWNTNTMKPVEIFNLNNKIHCHHMSPIATHHSLIAVAMDYPHCVLLDPKSGSYCHELRAHRKFLTCLRWSPSCEYLLATGSVDSKIFLWDIRSSKGYLSTLDQHNGELQGTKNLVTAHNGVVNGLRFTDDGLNLISCGTDCRLRLWDVALCTNSLVNYGLVINNNQYRQRSLDICCNTNPPVLFVPSSNYIFIFDLFSGSRVSTLVGHFSFVNCCLYRSKTNQVFSGGNDMNILLWTPDAQREIAEHKYSLGIEDEIEKSPQNSDNWSSDGEP